MAPVRFDQLKVATAARPKVQSALSRVSERDAVKVKDAFAQAAAQNGDRYLSAAEAQAVVDAFEAASGSASSTLSGQALATALDLAATETSAMAEKSNVDGVSAHFTFQESLEQRLIGELYDAVRRANGRPMDVCMMIFEFQSDEVEAAIVDIASKHPEVKFRIVADSGQFSTSTNNALPDILAKKLPNVEVKFKKDFPYVWSDSKGRPAYNHGATAGLNHHKGFATFIDGAPDRLVTGSFNWSDTADEKNYEDLTVIRAVDASTRRAVLQYADELAGFFNDDSASLSPNHFYNFRMAKWNELTAANGGTVRPFRRRPDDDYADYALPVDQKGFDVNGYRTADRARLEALLGTSLARSVLAERSRYGRFASLDELLERVPALASLPQEKLEALSLNATFGSGKASINNASVEELDNAGLAKSVAEAIVRYREQHGDFESLDDLTKVPGVTAARLRSAIDRLSPVDVEAFFNSRPYGALAAGTGYGSGGSRKTPVMTPDGVMNAPASVTAGATDLFARAQPGQSISIAMYGMSATSPELQALAAAARRGVQVRVVLNDAYTAATVRAIKALKAEGLPIDVRVQSARTMHEKFGVVGDDVFFGSANFSESSSTKHSEDRFVVKNHVEIASAYQSQFELLWARSKVV